MIDEQGEFEPIIPKFDFNWNDFHQSFDRALAPYLEDGGSIHDEIIKFAAYSHNRTMTTEKLINDALRKAKDE